MTTDRRIAPLAPALLAALFAGWSGTLASGANWPAGALGWLALAGMVFALGPPWRDPLRLGRFGAWLPLAWWCGMLASLAASPVPRAGWVGAALTPLLFCLPAAVARCWRSSMEVSSAARGVRGITVAVAAVAAWSLADWLVLGSPRPAMPLGHHNLLAGWLVTLAPLALVPVVTPDERRGWRIAAVASLALSCAAIVASRSLAATAGLAVEAALGALFLTRRRSVRIAAAALLLLAIGMQAPRLSRIAAAGDLSLRARATYLRAGLAAWRDRPVLGWGPGSTPWIISAHFEPAAGVNPPGETLGELHSLPVQVAAELGGVGFGLAFLLTVAFARQRAARRPEVVHPGLWRAALLGLAGAGVVSLASAAYAVTALPVAVAIALGAVLAAEGRPEPAGSPVPVRLVALAGVALVWPLETARFHYDRAIAAADETAARAHLASAVAWDPAFPLYRFRLALLTAQDDRTRAAQEALAAARRGDGVPLLWTAAGVLGARAGSPWAHSALEEACRTAPHLPLPHFFLMATAPDDPRAPLFGARALLAEPRLGAALFWRRAPRLQVRSEEQILALPGLDPRWREAFARSAALAHRRQSAAIDRRDLEIALDAAANESWSLFVFRRRPWSARWPVVALDASQLEVWDLGPAPPVVDLGRFPCVAPVNGSRLTSP